MASYGTTSSKTENKLIYNKSVVEQNVINVMRYKCLVTVNMFQGKRGRKGMLVRGIIVYQSFNIGATETLGCPSDFPQY